MARREFSVRRAQTAVEKLRAAEGLDQPVTLSPYECYLIITAIHRLQYRARR